MTEHKTLAEALVAAQAGYPEVEKTAKANYGKYATLDDLINKTRKVLNEHGLSIQQFPVATEGGQPALRTIIRHVSGETVQADTPLFLQKQDMQALGAAVTYARRYAWSAALGIASEHDDDANSIKADDKPARPAKPKQTEFVYDQLAEELIALLKTAGLFEAHRAAVEAHRNPEGVDWLRRQIAAVEHNLNAAKSEAAA